MQASVTYDARERHYVITQTSDVSQDTRVNDDPLSSTATGATSVTLAGYVRALKHDDVVGVGGTRLLCHVHDGMDTCDDCEPGIVRAKINEALAKEKAVWRGKTKPMHYENDNLFSDFRDEWTDPLIENKHLTRPIRPTMRPLAWLNDFMMA